VSTSGVQSRDTIPCGLYNPSWLRRTKGRADEGEAIRSVHSILLGNGGRWLSKLNSWSAVASSATPRVEGLGKVARYDVRAAHPARRYGGGTAALPTSLTYKDSHGRVRSASLGFLAATGIEARSLTMQNDGRLRGRPMNASILLALAALSTAQAAEPETLTLACQGTMTDPQKNDDKPTPISMGIIVDFANRTVHGFGSNPGFPSRFEFPVKITDMNEANLAFQGSNQIGESITGSIDRVTGDVEARAEMTQDWIVLYLLKCKPTQRLF